MGTLSAAVARALASVPVRPEIIPMAGGMDQVSPPLQRSPGTLSLVQNFEAKISGGYGRCGGYERVDGRPKPSAAQYAILTATITGSASLGQTLTGAGGATGTIIALPGGAFVLTKVVGVYVNGENLNVGGPPIATAIGSQVIGGADTDQLHAQYNNLAADVYRADIGAIPGSGKVLGVILYNDVRYGFRNNAGATAAEMYKTTTGGWVKVNFEFEVGYTVGSGSVDDGDVLTQGAVTATVRRVLVRTGTLAAGSAAGTLVISAPSGGNFGAGAATTTGGGTLTLAGIQTAIVLAPSGRYEMIIENFFGGTTTKRVYGCDGQNRAFEFDGNFFVPISTGMAVDKPSYIKGHKKHLFLSFDGSVQHSSLGAPLTWTLVLGAGEFGMGDTVTGFGSSPGSEQGASLPIFTRNRLSILYGSSVADWNLVPYRDEIGAFPYTIADMGYSMFLDDRGITDVQTTQSYGNFAHAVISNAVRNTLNQFRSLAEASCVVRDKSQYRLFFSNRYAFYVTAVGKKIMGVMQQLLSHNVRCIWSGETLAGNEEIYFGSDNGFVYQMDRGTSFDGDPIEYFMELNYDFSKSPRVNKHYHDAMIEIEGDGYAEFSFGYSLGYGSTDVEQPASQAVVVNLASSLWDEFTWDTFFWDGRTLVPSLVSIDGEAENIAFAFQGNSDYFQPFTITGMVMHITPRKRLRP